MEASESYRKAADSYSGLVDGDAATASQITVKQVADAKTVDALVTALKATEPKVVACAADDRAGYESKTGLIEKNTGWYGKHEKSLENAVRAVNDSKLEKTVSDAERLLNDSDGKVQDASTRDELSKAVKAKDADAIAAASKKVNDSMAAKTKADEEAQRKAEEEAAAQAAAQAQTTVTDAAKKAYEEATAALDAYVRAQSRRYTTAELRLTSLNFRCPLDSYGRITTQFGEADPWGIPHRGTDFAAPGGTPIYAIADGIVSAARAMNSYGNCVQVSHGTADDGCRYDSLYAHMSSIAVAEGTAVRRGDLLGYVGNTGNVYGTGGGYHLHLELRVNGSRTDPLGYVPSR